MLPLHYDHSPPGVNRTPINRSSGGCTTIVLRADVVLVWVTGIGPAASSFQARTSTSDLHPDGGGERRSRTSTLRPGGLANRARTVRDHSPFAEGIRVERDPCGQPIFETGRAPQPSYLPVVGRQGLEPCPRGVRNRNATNNTCDPYVVPTLSNDLSPPSFQPGASTWLAWSA